jgi:hypothetical protein
VGLPTRCKLCLTTTATVLALLTVPAGAAAADETSPVSTPAEVHLVAEQAGVARGLLRIEDTLTYDAVALRPHRGAPAKRIRTRNQWVIGICDAIIRADDRIQEAEARLREEDALVLDPNAEGLPELVADATEIVRTKLKALQERRESITVADMFEMQMLMNHLSQLSEMSTSVVSAANSAISSMVRNVKT